MRMTPLEMFPRRALVGLLLVAGACSSSGEVSGAFKPGTTVVIDRGAYAWEPGTPNEYRIYQEPGLSDVVRDGDRVVAQVSVVHNGMTGAELLVFLSDDRGATWSSHILPRLPSLEGLDQNVALGVHSVHGKLSFTAAASREVSYFSLSFLRILDWDLDATTWASDPADQTRELWAVQPQTFGQGIVGLGFERDARGGPDGSLRFYNYNVATRTMQIRQKSEHVTNGAYFALTSDGRLYEGYGFVEPSQRAQGMCLVRRDDPGVNEFGWYSICVPGQQIPAFLETDEATVATTRRVVEIYSGQGRTFATWIDASTKKLRVVDLGAGRYVRDHYLLNRRYAGYIALDTENGLRLLDLKEDGTLDEIVLPNTPCEDDAHCWAGAKLAAIVPLDGDEVLAFYFVEEMPTNEGTHRVLVTRHETIVRKPAQITGGPNVNARIPAYPNAPPPTRLEQLCLQAQSCFPARLEVVQCLERWLNRRARTDADDAAYQRFLTTPLGDCSALERTWPVVGVPQQGCTTGCHGDGIIRSCTVNPDAWPYLDTVDCSVADRVCRQDASTGLYCGVDGFTPSGCRGCRQPGGCSACEGGNAVNCTSSGTIGYVMGCEGQGLSCQTGPQWPDGPSYAWCGLGECDPAQPSRCVGDDVVLCAPNGQIFQFMPCARIGKHCVETGTGAMCADTTKATGCPGRQRCEDGIVFYCDSTEMHAIDCRDLGFTGCATDGPYCAR